MKSIIVNRVSVIGLVFIFLMGCSSGSDEEAGSDFGLDGTWRGNFNSTSDGRIKLSVTIQNNRVTQVLFDNVNVDLTGPLNKVNDNIYGYLLNGDSEGGFYVDSSKSHMAVLSDDFSFGVIEKNGSLSATFSSSDIVGDWSGYTVEVNGNLDIVAQYNSNATVLFDNSFSGVDQGGAFTGAFSNFSFTTMYSEMSGNFSSDSGANGLVTAYISPDKSFVGTYACDGFVRILDQCSFSAWRKQ